MSPLLLQATSEEATRDKRSVKILARTIYKELKDYGYNDQQVIALTTELIEAVTSGLNSNDIKAH